MFTFTSEFFLGILFGFVLGMLYNSQLHNMRILSKTMKSRITKPSANKTYSLEVETLWNDFKRSYDKRIKLNPKFSFNKMAFEIYKLLEEKAVAASTIRNFYLRRTIPREKTIEAIQRWIDEKENVNDEDDEHKNKEIDNSVSVINDNNSIKDNEI
jgi:hypothetical protein